MTPREAIEAAVTAGQWSRKKADRLLAALSQQSTTDPDAVEYMGRSVDGGDIVLSLEVRTPLEARITNTEDGPRSLTIKHQ